MSDIRRAAQFVLDTFKRDEADGYRSRDRQFAIVILARALVEDAPAERIGSARDAQAAEIVRLRKALKIYGEHSLCCAIRSNRALGLLGSCSCGLWAALAPVPGGTPTATKERG